MCGPEQLSASAAVLPYCYYPEDYGVHFRSLTTRCRQQALAKLHTYVPNCTVLLGEVTQTARRLTCIERNLDQETVCPDSGILWSSDQCLGLGRDDFIIYRFLCTNNNSFGTNSCS